MYLIFHYGMGMKIVIFALLIFLSAIGLAHAKADGNSLYENLKSNDPGENLIAYSYIDGFLDTQTIFKFSELSDFKPNSKFKFKHKFICTAAGADVQKGQLYDTVYKYLESHPEIRHQLGAILVQKALLEHFSCVANPN